MATVIKRLISMLHGRLDGDDAAAVLLPSYSWQRRVCTYAGGSNMWELQT